MTDIHIIIEPKTPRQLFNSRDNAIAYLRKRFPSHFLEMQADAILELWNSLPGYEYYCERR